MEEKREKTILVGIPAFNEQATIKDIIDRIPKEYDVLVSDDGSTDKTFEIVKTTRASIIRHNVNQGLGENFRTIVDYAVENDYDILVTIDADGQMFPEDIPQLVKPIVDKEAEVVTATRYKGKNLAGQPKLKRLGNIISIKLTNWITDQNLSDVQCGFRAYNNKALRRLTLFGKHTYVQETIIDLASKGFIIKEVPLFIKPKREGKSRLVKNQFTHLIKTGLIILNTLRDKKPFLFFGLPGLVMILISVGIFITKITLKLVNGTGFMEHPWVMITAFILLVLGWIMLSFTLLADMLNRLRTIIERLY